MNTSSLDHIKQTLGTEAAAEVKDQQIVGLGTGSTAAFFIQALARRVKTENLNIQCVASSRLTETLAKESGLVLLSLDDVSSIDISVDGADYIIDNSCVIKGAGGALLSEKLMESVSKRFIVITDYSKQLQKKLHLPVEVVALGSMHTLSRLKKLGYNAVIRKKQEEIFVSDLGNRIIDLELSLPIKDPLAMSQAISNVAGVIETGFFYQLATDIWIGNEDNSINKKALS
ncbi:MAG: ribose 5-phosphate isomerase A [Chlamydiales bacterium]|nr:ribose 5-phosphate isomerase A [Chlamydiales bacterium]